MKKVAIIIPTLNRPLCIDWYIYSQLVGLQKYNVDLIIFDGSSNRETEIIVKKYNRLGYKNIIYERFVEQDQMDNTSIDYKVYKGYKKFYKEYDYLWFSSDGTVINVNNCFNEIMPILDSEVDLIVTQNEENNSKIYLDILPISLFKGYCWSMTKLCSTIASNRVIERVLTRYPIEENEEFWFWIPSIWFYDMVEETYSIAIYYNKKLYEMNCNRTDSFWKESGNALWQWSRVWYSAIQRFPAFYEEYKRQVIRSHDTNTKIFSIRGLIHLRRTGNLAIEQIHKERKYLKEVTNTNILIFYFIALIFPRGVLEKFHKIYERIKNTRK